MPDVDLVLFDDEIARRWEPFALTRPIGELWFGATSLRERAERALGARCIGHLTAPHLLGFDEPGAAPVLEQPATTAERARIFLLSRFAPSLRLAPGQAHREEGPLDDGAGAIVGWYSPAGRPGPAAEFLLRPQAAEGLPTTSIKGICLGHPWDLITLNPEQLAADLDALFPSAVEADLPFGVHRFGERALVIGDGATIEPGCVLDTSAGPIWLDRESQVRAFTRLAGPAYVGRGSIILGGAIEAVTLGPMCRVRGELAESVCVGFVNKQHDGHIGHAYIGRWVNLGAGTTNSDLKNDYGTVRMWTPEGVVDTGAMKLGTLIGDHVKTGIGLPLNTGTVVGAGSNVYGAGMPPTYVPPFSWGTSDGLVEYRLEKFLQVADRAMSRRGVRLSEAMREQLARAWRRGRVAGRDDTPPGVTT